jgi:hypothetical protein
MMSELASPRVLLCRDENDRYLEVGLVLQRSGKALTVTLPNGETIDRELRPGELTPQKGSFIHLWRTDPLAVEQALEQEPAVVYKQLLLEAKGGLNARALKDKLSELRPDLVDRSWLAAKASIAADPEISASKARPPVYKFRGTSFAAFDQLFHRPPHDPAGIEGEPADHKPGDRLADLSSEPTSGQTSQRRHEEAAEPEALGTTSDDVSSADPQLNTTRPPSETVVPVLLTRLPDLATRLELRTMADAAANSLRLGDHVRKMSSGAQAELVDGLPAPQRRLLALGGGELKKGLLAAEVGALSLDDYLTAIDAAIEETLGQSKESKSLSDCLADLLTRAQAAGSIPAPRLIRLASVFSNSHAKNRVGLDETLRLIARQVRSHHGPSEMESWDLKALVRASRAAPLARTGGRAALLVALHSSHADEARQTRWWEGLDLADIAEAGQGQLAAVLEDPQVASSIVRPVVENHLDGIASRSGLAAVWALPPSVAQHVSGARLAQLLAELASSDPVASEWYSTLANADRIASLDSQVASQLASLEEARDEGWRQSKRADGLERDLLRAVQQLADGRTRAASDRQAHDRQIKLNLMRALAQLAAQVKQSEAARSDVALARQVDHLCSREGLVEMERPGEVVGYNPESHDALGAGLLTGSSVTVVRGGYTWTDGGDSLVLLRPQVVPVKD